MRRLVVCLIVLTALFTFTTHLFGQEIEEQIQYSLIGTWSASFIDWDDEEHDAGTISFIDEGTCAVRNKGTRYFEWWIDGPYFFLAELGYLYEFEDENTLILIPAYGEGTMKQLTLERQVN